MKTGKIKMIARISRGSRKIGSVIFATLFFYIVYPVSAVAGDVTVAVAANFLGPLKEIAAQFERETGNRIEIISGSTGKLYAQTKNGAPFEVFLSADSQTPKLLEDEGLGVAGSRRTYAAGRLTLWSPDPGRVEGDGAKTLAKGDFSHIAIANPKSAPYGKAAIQVLRALGVWEKVESRVVQGENIGQAFQFASSGNAELGLVSLSQVLDPKNGKKGSRWEPPPDLYEPLLQDMVLLKKGGSNPAAVALLEFLRGAKAAAIIQRYGYALK